MRRVTAGLFYSLDGVVEAPDRWQFDSFDEELGAELTGMIDRTDTVLLGRVSYQEWAGYWPNAEADSFGSFINPVEKFVASRTLTGDLEWQNSRLIDRSLEEFVTALRESGGGEIAVCGSISIVRQLLFARLLDSLTLLVHPVVAGGSGRHLFDSDDPATRLTLDDARRTSNGNAILSYSLRSE